MAPTYSVGVGLAFTAVAILCNGSFAAVSKIDRVQRARMDPMSFVLCLAVGVFLSSWAVIPFFGVAGDVTTAVHFTGYGIIAGALFVLAVVFSFFAIPFVGLSIAQGTWGGCALLVAFLWGTIAFDNPITNVGLAIVALALLIAGTLGIAFCQPLAARCFPAAVARAAVDAEEALLANQRNHHNDATDQRANSLHIDADDEESGAHASARRSKSEQQSTLSPMQRTLAGLACAIAVGIFGGAILVPSHYAPPEASGLGFMPSFGLGSIICGPVVWGVWWGLYKRALPEVHNKGDYINACIAGIVSGMIWNVGNAAAIFGIGGLGYSIAYPLVQCALFISGLWGIFLFKEIRGPAVAVFFGSSIVLMGGAVMLARFG